MIYTEGLQPDFDCAVFNIRKMLYCERPNMDKVRQLKRIFKIANSCGLVICIYPSEDITSLAKPWVLNYFQAEQSTYLLDEKLYNETIELISGYPHHCEDGKDVVWSLEGETKMTRAVDTMYKEGHKDEHSREFLKAMKVVFELSKAEHFSLGSCEYDTPLHCPRWAKYVIDYLLEEFSEKSKLCTETIRLIEKYETDQLF